MKRFLFAAVAIAFVALTSVAIAGGNELAYVRVQELPTLTAANVATGDFVPVYDASAGKVVKVDAVGTVSQVTRTAIDAVASGQTSKAVTVTGITAASRCIAQSNEVSTNAVYIRAVVPTANTATVTTSGDPGASNLDITVVCYN